MTIAARAVQVSVPARTTTRSGSFSDTSVTAVDNRIGIPFASAAVSWP